MDRAVSLLICRRKCIRNGLRLYKDRKLCSQNTQHGEQYFDRRGIWILEPDNGSEDNLKYCPDIVVVLYFCGLLLVVRVVESNINREYSGLGRFFPLVWLGGIQVE